MPAKTATLPAPSIDAAFAFAAFAYLFALVLFL
jgi:hypothetical protein